MDAYSEGQQIQMTWETASEQNNAGCGIELSSNSLNFDELAWVSGQGNSTESQIYSHRFESTLHGKQYIRLRQVDYDGAFEYSEVLEVSTEIPNGINLQPAYPNPFNPATTIQFSVAEEIAIRLAVYNSTGQLVAIPFSAVVPEAEIQNVQFNGTGLPSGTYFLRLESQLGSLTQAISLLK